MPSRRLLLASVLSAGGLAALGAAAWPRLGAYRDAVQLQRRPLGTAPDLSDLVRYATLAANGHNTQPWLFEVGPARISIRPDAGRRTPVVDPDDHHLFVSLGCAAENLALAADGAGRPAEVRIQGGADPSIDVDLGTGPARGSALLEAIPHRQSTRAPFDGQPVSPTDLALLAEAAREDGVTVDLRDDPADREALLEFVTAGNAAQMADPAFVAELRDWIRFTPDEALAAGDGLFAAASGNPVVPSWLARALFGAFFTVAAETDKYRDHIRSSAGFAVFTGAGEAPEHWMAVGRSFQRFALQATALGIRTAHVNQPVEVADLRGDFARWLGEPGRRPDLVVRFGRGPVLPMSLRRAPAEVMQPA